MVLDELDVLLCVMNHTAVYELFQSAQCLVTIVILSHVSFTVYISSETLYDHVHLYYLRSFVERMRMDILK